MACFSLIWLQQMLIWLIIVCAVVACIRLLIPWVTGFTGMPIVGQVLNIILWAVIAIMAITIIFNLLSCLVGMGGLHLMR